jgi:hypothetical protein
MIKVKWEPNVISGGVVSFNYDELNTTKEEWEKMSENDRLNRLQDALDNLPAQLCMMVVEYE